MAGLLYARVAVLQALRDGPAYGDELRHRLLDRTSGQVRLGHGPVYAALAALARAGLVRTWKAPAGGATGRGRRRAYCELTRRGVREARQQGEALGRLFSGPAVPSAAERNLMSERLIACDDLSASVAVLRDAMLRSEAG